MGLVTERLAILVTMNGGQAVGQAKQLGGAFGTVNTAQLALGTGAAALGGFMLDAAKKTSAFTEQLSASQSIFGPATQGLQEFAKSAESIGLSERAALQGANAIGGLFKQAGASQQEAAELSEATVRLGSDLASMRDIAGGSEAALNGLRSGLAGEIEPLKNLGVFFNDADVRARAVQLGLAKTHAEVDEGAKIMARYNLIIEQTTDAQGNYAATSDGMANSQRTLDAAFENLQKTLGEQAAPAIAEFNKNLTDLINLGEKMPGGLFTNFQRLGALLNPLGFAFNHVKGTVGDLQDELTGETDAADKNAKKTAEVKQAQDLYTESLKTAANVTRENKLSEEQLTKQRDEATRATLGRRDAEEGLQDAQKATTRAQRDAKEAEEELAELIRQGAVDAEDVARAKERAADASEAVTAAQKDEARSAKEVGQAQRDVAAAMAEVERVKKGASPRDLKEAELDLRDAQRDRVQATLDVTEAEQKWRDLLQSDDEKLTWEDLREAMLGIEEAKDGAERAALRLGDAQAKLTETQNRGKEGSKDLKDALDILAEKQEALADKVQDQAAAHENVADKQREQIKAGEELAKSEEGDPEFADKVAQARQRVADAHDNTARAKRNERDATEELQKALEEFKKKVTDVAQQGVGTPIVSTTAVGGQDFTPVRRNAPVAAAGFGPIILQVDGREFARVSQEQLAAQARRNGNG